MRDLYSLSYDGPSAGEEIWVFKERVPPEVGPALLKPSYAQHACRRCGKFDVFVAALSGIDKTVRGASHGRDAVISSDHQLLVSTASRAAINQSAPDQATFVQLPGDPSYWLMLPVKVFYPPEDARIYKPIERPVPGEAFHVHSRRCSKCGRRLSTTISLEWLDVPEEFQLAAAFVELQGGNCLHALIASQIVIDALRIHSPKGWRCRALRPGRQAGHQQGEWSHYLDGTPIE